MVDLPLRVVVGRVIELAERYVVIEPGVRVEVADLPEHIVVGRRVVVRAVRQGRHLIAESIALDSLEHRTSP